ncbi:MAG: protein-L-isoaspartate O-methyltransferase [Sphingomonadaceae bacterium]|nr:protein-L-isoaspartate O-methyltransferase [Sphingomonadaceae bacterium]
MDRFETMRAAMIDNQLRPTGVNDPRVLAAFAEIERERFVPEKLRGIAYLDDNLEVAPGRYMLDPLVFGNLVNRAEFDPSDKVLLIGLGTGYEAAVIAQLVDRVIGVEPHAGLAAQARAALANTKVTNVTVVEAALGHGAPEFAPFDALFLNGAAELLPQILVDQLRDGGRFAGVTVDDMGLTRGVSGAKSAGVIGTTAFLDAGVPRLPGLERPRAFRF